MLPTWLISASVDRKGRLKFPSLALQFWRSQGNPRLFITSLDRKVGRIYPAADWWRKAAALSAPGPVSGKANGLMFNAVDLGEEADIDGEGRVLLPSNMRRELGLEDSQVWLYLKRGRIDVLSSSVYEARKREAMVNIEANLADLENEGYL